VTEQYHAFTTSMTYPQTLQYLEELPPEYRSRWGIETGYRQTGERARTTGTNPDVQMLLFHLSAFVYNMWAVERARDGLWCAKKEFTLLTMTCALVYAATDACNRGFPGPPPDWGCL